MRLLFDYCYNYPEDSDDVKLGIGGYRHSKEHPWFGFTINLYLIHYRLIVIYVSNYKKYNEVINKRWPRSSFNPKETE